MIATVPVDAATRALLEALHDWSERRWIRRLDGAFARFVVDRCPAAPAVVVMAAAWLAHVEGKGHSCLLLDRLLADSAGLLGLDHEAQQALQARMDALPRTLDAWLGALRASPLVRSVDRAGAGGPDAGEPLVLCESRLYLRRYWQYEEIVAAQVTARSAVARDFDPAAARRWLDRLFPAADGVAAAAADAAASAAGAAAPAPVANGAFDWQKAACGLALAGSLSIVTGGPGTGKTYTAARLLALLIAVDPAPERLRIALAAPTGKAAARLRQAIGDALGELQAALGDEVPLAALAAAIGPARTLHALLGARPDTRRFAYDAAHPLEIDVLIVDEASMIHLEMMAALFDALPPAARVVLLGDKDQLASVEAGAVLGDLCRDAEAGRYRPQTAALLVELTGQELPARHLDEDGPALAQHTVMLRSSRRFGGPIGQLAAAVNRGDVRAAQALLAAPPDASLGTIAAPRPAPLIRLAVAGYRGYLKRLRSRPRAAAGSAAFDAWIGEVLAAFDRFRVLCALREGEWGVAGLNRAIELALEGEGLVTRRGEWWEGRPVMVTRNDASLGVFNGDIGIVLRPPRDAATGGDASRTPPLRVYFPEGGAHRSVSVSRLAHVETAFALTVHKAQGSEFAHTVLVLPDTPSRVLTRELVYTAITRARETFTLAAGNPGVFADALAQRTLRASGLLERIDAG